MRNLALGAVVVLTTLLLPLTLAFWIVLFTARWHHAANRARPVLPAL